ncbi:hypothetical protein [Parabacteroides distasonis]|uniref:hypothetical protein n=1 Tax=Parabacteroides distasonis TaxID=823 RepID=UPI00189CC76F|nr:hypothetical protein [Parabacteroides distasonis]MDB9150889.1 hypothetical protein [Parabacteroides distasonis]MDB9155399.1 hypothetical protein [Parabacteroides distasonis]MDB9163805.1 hypothetical protein [Parabacteroides distasonis]MDB9167953.1 hypothetical protein [Parabacteroides distasonis]MDB9195171.1 hypothetical protein [Parabacteroides distasonis]
MEISNENDARAIYSVEGWYELSSGYRTTFQIGSNLRIPDGITTMYLYITSPVLTSYTFTSSVPGLVVGSSGNQVLLSSNSTPYSSLHGTGIDVSGYCPSTGQNETFHISFLPEN